MIINIAYFYRNLPLILDNILVKFLPGGYNVATKTKGVLLC